VSVSGRNIAAVESEHVAPSVDWGSRWEALRAHYWRQQGQEQYAQECQALADYYSK
tara:strand:+ start:116 stop:283 length:168 start_codon:yes stop_codon:yes gene_type:complete